MRFHLGLGRSHSSSHLTKRSDPQFHAVGSYADTEWQRPANTGNQWTYSDSAEPPPYTSVVANEIRINEAPHAGRSSAAAGPSRAPQSMTLPPGSRHTRVFMIHPAFASSNRLRDVAYLQAPMRRESKEDALDMLRAYDTVVIMDDSGSMLQDNRWEQVCYNHVILATWHMKGDFEGL